MNIPPGKKGFLPLERERKLIEYAYNWSWRLRISDSIHSNSDELNTGLSQAINDGLNLSVVFLFSCHEDWDCGDVLEEETLPQYLSDLAGCGHIPSGLHWCAEDLLLRADRWHYRGGGSVKYLGCNVLVGEMDLQHVWLQVFYDSRGCGGRRSKHHLLCNLELMPLDFSMRVVFEVQHSDISYFSIGLWFLLC